MNYRSFTAKAYSAQTGASKYLACFCNIILSLYITLLVIMYNFADAIPGLGVALVCGLLLFAALYQAIKLFLINFRGLEISRHTERKKLCRNVFTTVSSIIFFLLLLNFFAHYPGGISPDNISQWEQLQTGVYTDWHPAIHTMLIWLITRINESYTFFIGVQILSFSLICGYMAATLDAWGLKRGWIIAFVIMIISTRTNGEIMLFAGKDSAFSILILCLAVFMINIVLSDGSWLSNNLNVAAFAIITALCSIIRHDGLFFTVPVFALVIIVYAKINKKTIFAVAASILAVVCVKFVIYPVANVQYVPSQTYVESVGLPMTVLSGVMVNNFQALDPETDEFLNRITNYQTWKDTYETGNFNSIRYVKPTTDVILSVSPGKLFSMTLRTIWNAPREALLEVIALTRIVWSPLDWDQRVVIYVEESAIDTVVSQTEIDSMWQTKITSEFIYESIRDVLELLTPFRILSTIGMHMLFLILAGVYSVNCNLGKKALLLFVPSAVYNLGTMLLLFGPDCRFFHFNMLISLPLIIALLSKARSAPEQQPDEEPAMAAAQEGDPLSGVTERLKAENQMEWVGRMNNIRACADEIVSNELIYE